MRDVFICDAVRTPIGRFGGVARQGARRRSRGGADQGPDGAASRARLGWRRRGLFRLRQPGRRGQPQRRAHGAAAGRAAGSGSRAHASTGCAPPASTRSARRRARSAAGEIDFAIAGGVESMTRAPFVMGKAAEAFSRSAEIFDTTIGWRFINPLMKAQYGVDAMPETGENVAEEFQVSRADQDAFAIRSQQRAGSGDRIGLFRRGDRRRFRGARRQGRTRSRSTRTSIRAPKPRSKARPS